MKGALAIGVLFLTMLLLPSGAAAVQPDGTGVRSYIVVMQGDPAVAYEGDIEGYRATKPGKGQKINPNSAHVRKYQRFLEKNHSASLAAAGVDESATVNDYTIALNGYSAVLTEEVAKAVETQIGVLEVIEDTMRQPTTDSSASFLGLTDAGGAYLKGLDGSGVVVGVIDTGIWPEHPSFADDGSYAPPPIPPWRIPPPIRPASSATWPTTRTRCPLNATTSWSVPARC